MNTISKLFVFVSLYLISMLGLGVSNSFCAGSPEDLRKAATRGDANAQYQLGWAYSKGQGVLQDDVEAFKWYLKAAEQGHMGAQATVGDKCGLGRGTPKNSIEQVRWYRKAAEQGQEYAQNQLALSYAGGSGVPKDEIEALAWFYIVVASGGPFATIATKDVQMLENHLGNQGSLQAQQRSREIFKKIESANEAEIKHKSVPKK